MKNMQEFENGAATLVGCPCAQEGQGLGRDRSGCGGGCGAHHYKACRFGVEGSVLAAAFVPVNPFDDLYDKETSLRRGTMFAALDKPFYGGGREVDCRGYEK